MSTTLASSKKQSEENRHIDHKLAGLVRTLTDPVDSRHSQAVEMAAQLVAFPPLRTRLIGLLLRRLQSGDAVVRKAAGDVLVTMGKAATADLVCRFIRSRSAAAQIRMVWVLAGIGRTLSPEKRTSIQTELDILSLRWGRGPEVALAVAQAQDELRPAEKEVRRWAARTNRPQP